MMKRNHFWEENKYIIPAIFFGIIATIYTYNGFGINNHIDHLPFIIRNLNPSFLINDFYTNAGIEGIARQYYAVIMSQLAGSEENLPILFLTVTLLTNISISLSSFYFAKKLFKGSSLVGILASATVLSIPAFRLAEIGSFLHLTYLVPSDIAFAFILWALYFAAQGNLILSIFLTGIATIIHPLFGLEMGALILFSYPFLLIVRHQLKVKKEWGKILISFAVFLLFSLPSIVPQLTQESIDSNLFIYIYAYFRIPHHEIPSSFPIKEYVIAFIFLINAGYIGYKDRKKMELFPLQLMAVQTGSILLLCVFGYIFVEIIPLRLMVIAQPFRLLQVVKWFGLILIAGFLFNPDHDFQSTILYFGSIFHPFVLCGSIVTQKLRYLLAKKKNFFNILLHPASILVIIVTLLILEPGLYSLKSIILFLIFVTLIVVFRYFPQKLLGILLFIGISGTLIIGLFHSKLPYIKDSFTINYVINKLTEGIHPQLGADGNEVAKFARENTPTNSVFLTPPNWGQFRLMARRAIVVDFKAFLFTDSAMMEWYERLTTCYGIPTGTGFSMIPELEANYRSITDEKLLQLQKEYHFEYVVLYSETTTDFNVIYENDIYKVVEMDDIP